MTTSLSARVKRVSLNQWRYYCNRLLFIGVPLRTDSQKDLLPLAKNDSDSSSERGSGRCSESGLGAPVASHGLTSNELIRNELAKYKFTRQRLESALNRVAAPNIYSDMMLNKVSNHDHVTVVALPVPQDSHSVNSLVNINSSIIGSAGGSIGLIEEHVMPVDAAAVKVPVSLARVSSLLAAFL